MDKLFLFDAYALIYRSYYAFMKNPRINSKGLNTSCVMGFCNTLNEILTKEKPTHIGVAFDHGKTFRHEAFPAYKAQREETPEDIKLSVPIIKTSSKLTISPSFRWMDLRLTTSSVPLPLKLAKRYRNLYAHSRQRLWSTRERECLYVPTSAWRWI